MKTIEPKTRNKRNDLNAMIAPIKNLRFILFCLGRNSSRLRIGSRSLDYRRFLGWMVEIAVN